MVRSDLSSSGVMFSIDTESGFKDAAFITGSYGLGENVVQGAVNPDEYYVFKPTLKKGFRPIIQKEIGSKEIKMIYTDDAAKPTKNVPVAEEERKKFVISEDEIIKLAKWACIIEDHYSKKAGYFKPMDMEWAKDGKTQELFIVQARPETVQSQKDLNVLETYKLEQKGKVVVTGNSVGERIGQGPAHVIKDVKDIAKFKAGEDVQAAIAVYLCRYGDIFQPARRCVRLIVVSGQDHLKSLPPCKVPANCRNPDAILEKKERATKARSTLCCISI